MKVKKDLILPTLTFILFLFLAIFITYPLVFNLGKLSVGLGDELVIAWIQNSVIHSLLTNPLNLFNANLYFPYQTTLAYSDLFIPTSILSIIPLLIIKQPIATVNFTLITSLALLGFSIYLLSFYISKNFIASILSGVLVIFSPAVLDKATHLQILAIEAVPISILFFIIFISSNKTKFLVLSLVFFLIQTYNSFMPGYFILFSYLIIFAYAFFYKRKQVKKIINKKNLLIFLFSILLILPIALPYYKVSKEFNYTRNIKDSIHLALQPEDLLYPSDQTIFKNLLRDLPINQTSQNNEFKAGFLGLVFSLLAIVSLGYFLFNFKKKDLYINSFATIALTGLVLSLGPALHLGRQTLHVPFPIPLPYALFYYILPGFSGFRNSSRWEMLFVLALAVLIAMTLPKLLKNLSKNMKIAIYILIFLGVILEFKPFNFVSVPQKEDFPKVYSYLNTIPKTSAVIIMPAYSWNSPLSSIEIKRDYYSISNFRRTVNGYSGFFPAPWESLIYYLEKNFPNKQSIVRLENLGVDYVIVDKKAYEKRSVAIKSSLKQNSTLVKDFSDYSVYELNH